MNFLETLTAEQRQVLIRLPYRVGLWVSRSDSAGGAEADAHEAQALASIIHGFAEEVFGSENIQYILHETIKYKAQWSDWAANLDQVPDDCRQAIDLMRHHASIKDAAALKTHLVEIAEAVAMAFREEGGTSVFSTAGRYVSYVFTAKKPGVRKRSFAEFLNISKNEQKALDQIVRALEAA